MTLVESIEYDPFSIGPRTFWVLELNLSRMFVPSFCQQLHSIVQEKNGACFYYPDLITKKTNIRFEWNVPYKDKKFGLKLGMNFSIDDKKLKTIEVFVSYGIQLKEFGQLPSFTNREIESYNKIFIDVIEKALYMTTPESKKNFHILFHIEIPPTKRISKPIKIDGSNIIIFPTVINKKDNKRTSAIVITVNESSLQIAKAVALRKIAIFCALLTISSGKFYNTINLDWPKNRKPIVTIDNIKPIPNNESLYPFRRWIECNDKIDYNIEKCSKRIIEIYNKLSDTEKGKLLNPIFAYYVGKEILFKQPTLATVSFIAALSPFIDIKTCKGLVNCDKCGTLNIANGSNFHHYLIGDKASLLKSLYKILKIKKGDKQYEGLNILINNIYNKHRSAFVHGSAFRHGEFHEKYDLPISLPTAKLPFSELLIYKQDLLSFEPIVRRALLELLAKKANVSLDYETFNLDEFYIRHYPSFEMVISSPAKILVRIKLQPDNQRK